MPTREELIAQAQQKWERTQLITQAQAKWDAQSKTSGPSETTSAVRGTLSGLMASFDDEVIGGLGAAGRVAGVKNLGSWKPFDPNSHLEMASEPLSMDEVVTAYRENRDAIRDDQKKDFATNPKATFAGNMVGAIASPIGKIKAAQGMGTLTRMGTLGQAAKTGAMQGAVFGAGASDSDLTKGEIGQFAKDTGLGIATGAAVPYAIEGVKEVVKGGAKAAAWTGKKAGSMAMSSLGVNAERSQKYLASSERINAAKSFGDIKDLVDESVGKLSEAVKTGKVTETEAKESLRALKDQVTRGLSDKKVDSKDALKASESVFAGARERVLAPLKAKSAPTDRAADVAGMVGELKQKIQGKSGQALETLKDSGEQIDMSKVYGHIDETLVKLKESGTDEALSVAEKLKAYKSRLMTQNVSKQTGFQPSGKPETLSQAVFENEAKLSAPGARVPARFIMGSNEDQWLKSGLLGKQVAPPVEFQSIGPKFKNVPTLGAPQAKKLIQGIDQTTEYSKLAGSFDKVKNSAFKGVRGEMDQALKESVPSYRAQMADLAPEVRLLDDANAAFGSPEVGVGKLGRLNTPRGEFDRATLGKLEQAVGKAGAVTREADEFAKAQKILKDPQALQKIERSLPEYDSLRRAMADVAKRNPKWTRQQIEQATAQERRQLATAMSKRIFAEKKMEPFKALAPGSTENKLKSVMKGARNNIENEKILTKLSKETGHDFLQMADDRALLDSFSGKNVNGSRNTLFGSIIGFVVGGLTGGIPGAMMGASSGAVFGHTVLDNYGPKVGKKILDGVITLRKNPSIKTIRSLEIPQNVKNELEREFKLYMISPRPKGEERWAQRGLEKLGIQDRDQADQLLQSKEGKRLLIEASDMKPGSPGMNRILKQIESMKGLSNDSRTGTETEILRLQREPSSGR